MRDSDENIDEFNFYEDRIFLISVFSSRWSNRSSSSSSSICKLLLLLCWFQNLETAHQCIINWHHCSSIVKLSTIVRSWKESDQLSFSKELITIFNDLMSSANQVNVMFFAEGCHNFLAKGKWDSSVVLTPPLHILIRVRPKQVTEQSCVWHISWSHDSFNLV